MEPLATVDQIQKRLDFIMDEQERAVCAAAIEDASDLAREHGRDWPTVSVTPRSVLTLVRRVVARHMKNPNGYSQSRAGDETLQWGTAAQENHGDVYFTTEEQKMIARQAGRSHTSLMSVGTYAWSNQPVEKVGFVPVEGHPMQDPFPMFASDRHPW